MVTYASSNSPFQAVHRDIANYSVIDVPEFHGLLADIARKATTLHLLEIQGQKWMSGS